MSRTSWQPAMTVSGQTASATLSVTCMSDGRAHAVRDSEIAQGTTHCSGYYSAVCGHVVTPASMVAPDGELCRVCAERDVSHSRRRRERYRYYA